jgi:hypothetical protein
MYNTRRRHSALGHLSPSEYEEVDCEEAPWLKGKQSVETGQTHSFLRSAVIFRSGDNKEAGTYYLKGM